jgi:hypothetical protein
MKDGLGRICCKSARVSKLAVRFVWTDGILEDEKQEDLKKTAVVDP